jgi:hypothetical protein
MLIVLRSYYVAPTEFLTIFLKKMQNICDPQGLLYSIPLALKRWKIGYRIRKIGSENCVAFTRTSHDQNPRTCDRVVQPG